MRSVCIANAFRVAYTLSIPASDFTWLFVVEGFIVGVELYIGIAIACIPTLKPVAERFGRSKGLTTAGKTSSSKTNGLNSSHNEFERRNYTELDDGYLLEDRTKTFGQHSAVASKSLDTTTTSGVHDDERAVTVRTDLSVYETHVGQGL